VENNHPVIALQAALWNSSSLFFRVSQRKGTTWERQMCVQGEWMLCLAKWEIPWRHPRRQMQLSKGLISWSVK